MLTFVLNFHSSEIVILLLQYIDGGRIAVLMGVALLLIFELALLWLMRVADRSVVVLEVVVFIHHYSIINDGLAERMKMGAEWVILVALVAL